MHLYRLVSCWRMLFKCDKKRSGVMTGTRTILFSLIIFCEFITSLHFYVLVLPKLLNGSSKSFKSE